MRHPGGVAGTSGSRGAVVALWVVFAAAAVASGWIAVQMVGSAVSPGSLPVLSADDVERKLETADPRAGRPSPGPSDRQGTQAPTDDAQPTPDDVVVRTLTSAGGSAVAACSGDALTVRSVSPAVGFRVGEVEQESGGAEIRFVGSSAEVKMELGCASGVPQSSSEVDEESGDDD